MSYKTKVGVHSLTNAGITYIHAALQRGVHLAVCKAVNDVDWLVEVKALAPDVITLARVTSPDEGLQFIETETDMGRRADALFAPILAKLEANPALWDAVDYWEICNEPDPPGLHGYTKLAECMIVCMERAEQLGLRLGLFALNAGTPELWEMDDMIQTGVFAKAKAGGHIMTVHEGVFKHPTEGWIDPVDLWWGDPLPTIDGDSVSVEGAGPLCFRYRFLYDKLKRADQVVPLVVSEIVYGGGYAGDGGDALDVTDRVMWYDVEAQKDDFLLAHLPFTVGAQGEWLTRDYGFAYPAILDAIANQAGSEEGGETMPETPEMGLEETLITLANENQIIFLNRSAALQRAIARDYPYVTTSNEFTLSYEGANYTAQRAESYDDGTVRVYYAAEGDWENVKYVPESAPPQVNLIADIVDQLPTHPTKRYATRDLSAITTITIHHTVSPADRSAESIAAMHVNSNDWPGIGYHYLVGGDGTIFRTNKHTTISYHDRINTDSIGVALAGNFTNQPPGAAQLDATVWLVSYLKRELPNINTVTGHRLRPDNATQCPGNTYETWLPGLGWASPNNNSYYNENLLVFVDGPASDWKWVTAGFEGKIDWAIHNGKIDGLKLHTNGVNYQFYKRYAVPNNLVRLVWKPHQRRLTASELWSDVREDMMRLYNEGARDFEFINNEANLEAEGAGVQWADGADFGAQFVEVGRLCLTEMPDVRLWYPGMSPGVPSGNQFLFTDPAWEHAKRIAYGMCVHAYTDGAAGDSDLAARQVVDQVRAFVDRYPGTKVWVSECSVNRGSDPAYKAEVYRKIIEELKTIERVVGVVFFTSWWTPDPNAESWFADGSPAIFDFF